MPKMHQNTDSLGELMRSPRSRSRNAGLLLRRERGGYLKGKGENERGLLLRETGREGGERGQKRRERESPSKVTVSRRKHCLSGSAWRCELGITVPEVQR